MAIRLGFCLIGSFPLVSLLILVRNTYTRKKMGKKTNHFHVKMEVTPLRFTYDDLKTASENFSRKLGITLSMKEASMLMGPKWA